MGSVPAFSRSGAGETQLFPFGIMDSATSGFRPLTFICRSIAIFDPFIFDPPRRDTCLPQDPLPDDCTPLLDRLLGADV